MVLIKKKFKDIKYSRANCWHTNLTKAWQWKNTTLQMPDSFISVLMHSICKSLRFVYSRYSCVSQNFSKFQFEKMILFPLLGVNNPVRTIVINVWRVSFQIILALFLDFTDLLNSVVWINFFGKKFIFHMKIPGQAQVSFILYEMLVS